jgi:hypothetical protein
MIRHPLVFLALVLPSTAIAQDRAVNGGRLELGGTAPTACAIRTPSGGNGINATFEATGGASGRIRISELVDATTATSRAASIDLVVPVICNGPHRVTLRSGNRGLRRDGAQVAAGGFSSTLPYSLNIVWGSDRSSSRSDGGAPLILRANEARSGQLSLQVALARGDTPLVAGTYSDQNILEFQPAS